MSDVVVLNPEINNLGSLFDSKKSSSVSALLNDYIASETEILEKVINEFGETCLSNERREAFRVKFSAGIEDQLNEFLGQAEIPVEKLSIEDIKEFLKRRFNETRQRSVTIDLIDEIRTEGLGEQVEEKFRSVETDLEEEAINNPDKGDAFNGFKTSINTYFEREKSKLSRLDLADEEQLKAYKREQLEFFEDVDTRVNQFLKQVA